ncbi:MAG: AAA family ATPase, partial [Caulobacterales bacterium]|nr:AAA family ATPase [Caulobacterales bacterium]
LLHRELAAHANALLNAYLAHWRARDLAGLAVLGLMISLRAGVRAKVALDRRGELFEAPARADLAREAGAYLELALAALRPSRPALVAVGGLSGCGKSRIAAELAPRFPDLCGAIVLRSDVERKAMAGVSPHTHLPARAYDTATTQAVYARLRAKAAIALAAGHAVIVDAVHAREEERAELQAVAARVGAPFAGLWLDCGGEVRRTRVAARTGDASDADAAVIDRQEAIDLGRITWARIDAERTAEAVASDAMAALRARGVAAPHP